MFKKSHNLNEGHFKALDKSILTRNQYIIFVK